MNLVQTTLFGVRGECFRIGKREAARMGCQAETALKAGRRMRIPEHHRLQRPSGADGPLRRLPESRRDELPGVRREGGAE
jgi:hypothetical protein